MCKEDHRPVAWTKLVTSMVKELVSLHRSALSLSLSLSLSLPILLVGSAAGSKAETAIARS